jgi:hypothetical protein
MEREYRWNRGQWSALVLHGKELYNDGGRFEGEAADEPAPGAHFVQKGGS